MKSVVIFLAMFFVFGVYAQTPPGKDSLPSYESEAIPVYTKDYKRRYNQVKTVILKVYPYALHAADKLDEINNNVASIEKRRKQNQFLKDSYKDLKDEFKYVFYELYTHEGIMLMKLVHRETGLTVYEIAERYRGKEHAEMFELMGKIWDQDLNVKFDAKGEDKIAEHVIQDIQRGIVPFKSDVDVLTKEEYKVEQQKDADRKKAQKDREKAQKKKEREKARQERKNND